jgi:two-component system sensor histidine kinase HydH
MPPTHLQRALASRYNDLVPSPAPLASDRPSRRGPLVAALAIAGVVAATALFIAGGLARAAAAVGARPDAAAPALVRDLRMLTFIVAAISVSVGAAAVALGARLSQALRDEDALLARAAHRERLAALGQMSAVLAHELRNPLASLKGNAQLLAEALGGDEARARKAERVVTEALRLERLTNELLEFARDGALRRTRGDLGEVVRAAASQVGPPVAVQLADAPTEAAIDPGRLQLAVENLLRNAVESSPPEGAVTASVRAEGDRLVLEVRDHGPGIAAGEEESIFQPFFTHKSHGTGLGLAVARRIVEQHGGRVVAANHPAGGALFRVTLPRAE